MSAPLQNALTCALNLSRYFLSNDGSGSSPDGLAIPSGAGVIFPSPPGMLDVDRAAFAGGVFFTGDALSAFF